jgi:hypothetical protein
LRAPRAERRRLWTATEAAVADPLSSGHALHTYANGAIERVHDHAALIAVVRADQERKAERALGAEVAG